MSSTNAPFGLMPAKHLSGGTLRPEATTIASGYGTAIYKNGAVKMLTDGTIGAAAAGDAIIGSFQGCEYTDATGIRVEGHYWPASTVATDIVAYVTMDPNIVYLIQADGSVATSKIGEMADITAATAGSTVTGWSATTIANGTSTTTAQLQVIGIPVDPDNVAADTYTKVLVRIGKHQLVANPAAGV